MTGDYKKEYEEGAQAAREYKHMRDYCPYTFDKAGVDQVTFDREYRPRMNAWFDGWKHTLDAAGLGFNFEPKRSNTRRKLGP